MQLFSLLTRWWAVAALIAAAFMLGAAHWFESQGLPPCPLCLRQREVYWAALTVAALAVGWTLISRAKGTPRLAAFVLFAIFSAGVVTATFHAGGEQGWWALPATCMGTTGPISSGDILASLDGPATSPSCGDIAWSWLGLSMAAWNAIISFGLAGLSLVAAVRPRDAQAPRLYREP